MLTALQFLDTLRRPTILPLGVRKALVAKGLTRIRQTQYGMGLRCPAMLAFSPQVAEQGSIYMLFGSMFHLAFIDSRRARGQGNDPEYYLDLFSELRALDPNTIYQYQGSRLQWSDLQAYARKFADPSYLTMTLGELVARLTDMIMASGHRIVAAEETYTYVDGVPNSKYAIAFYGTGDLRTELRNNSYLWDVKTSGLWGPYIDGSSNGIKKQSFETAEIEQHRQLRHYGWLLYLSNQIEVTHQGILSPANLVPYFKGDQKGMIRGLPFFESPSLGPAGRAAYERDLVNFFTSFTNLHGAYRAYPSTFGTPDCPECSYFNACQGDLTSASQRDALSSPQFDYLR